MSDARTGTGHFAWGTWGLAALGAHVLLLWSLPRAPVETSLATATTIAWEAETWETLAPTSPMADDAAGPAGPPAPPEAPKAVQAPRPRRAAKVPAETKPAALAVGSAESPNAPASPSAVAAAAAESGEATAAPSALAAVSGTTASGAASGTTSSGTAASGTGTGTGASTQGAGALLRGPRLLATRDPCAGFFPGTAQVNRGQVQLSIDVDAQGHPHPTQTLLELPLGQGFETAAKACAAHLHFAPALDAQGHPVSARARIALRFERS